MTLRMGTIAAITAQNQNASIMKTVIVNAIAETNPSQMKKSEMSKELNAAKLLLLMEKRAMKKRVICSYCSCSPELCFCQKG